jgi:hypothetical protein
MIISTQTLAGLNASNKKGHTVYCRHDESDLHGVGRAGKVSVNLLRLVLVERDESVQDVVAGRSVVGAALVVGEVVLHGADGQLLLESIDLVKEQNDRCLDEPSRVADGVEEREGLLHTVDGLILEQQLVVFGNGDEEENGGDVLEAVDPLLTLRSLTSNIEHAVGKVTNDECGLGDTSCLDTGSENVLVVGNVVGSGDAVNRIEVARFVSMYGREKAAEGD